MAPEMSEPMAPHLIYIHRESVYSPPPPSPSRSYMRRRATSLNESFLSRRYILLGSAIVVILLMCTGVIFAAHSYYHQWGGQGFLRARDQDLQEITPNVFLPMKKIGVYEDGSLLSYLPPFKRDPQMDIPYYACGDQQNSCEAFQQPNICCPVGMTCYAATFTLSGIFCCNATTSQSEWACQISASNPPKCMNSLVECPKAAGGGCCPNISQCSPNGCIFVNSASTVMPLTTSSSASSKGPVVTMNSFSVTGTPITITSTVTIAPQATVTLAKEGEVAYAPSAAGRSLVASLWLPYSFACALMGLAMIMGML